MTLATTTVAGRQLADYVPMVKSHDHGLDTVVGYVIRKTISDGTIMWHSEGCGYDVATVDGSNHYASALEVVRTYRVDRDYAVIDMLYSCGCRS